jgi:hypothetical protein
VERVYVRAKQSAAARRSERDVHPGHHVRAGDERGAARREAGHAPAGCNLTCRQWRAAARSYAEAAEVEARRQSFSETAANARAEGIVAAGLLAVAGLRVADPYDLLFSQRTASAEFSDGRSVQKTIDDLRAGQIKVSSIPVVTVAEIDGRRYSWTTASCWHSKKVVSLRYLSRGDARTGAASYSSRQAETEQTNQWRKQHLGGWSDPRRASGRWWWPPERRRLRIGRRFALGRTDS